jgi:4-amino-4-deoxy-L-arabinose transferase-like glycosyltransferase
MEENDEQQRLFGLAFAIVAAVTAVRVAVLIASPLQLYPDEAQYWWWAQTPDLGYFSKPPLIAWIIRATTLVFGDREWAIRFAIPFFHAGSALLLFAIARSTYPRAQKIAFWSALAYLTLPGVSYSAGLASTDAPLLFFWTLALFALLRAAQSGGWRWPILCGAAIGLGVLAKYAMLFFVVSAVLAAMASRPLRRIIFSRQGAAAIAIMAVIIAPNVAWNASHDFATVAHTQTNADWSHASLSALHLLVFVAGQFGVFGPILMAAWLVSLWRIARDGQTTEEAFLFAMSAPTLAFIAIQSFISDANANWAATAYVAAIPLAVSQILRYWPRALLWTSFALHGAVLALLWAVLLWPPVAERLGVGNVFKREEGWRELADGVKAQFVRGGFSIVATDNRSVTAELLYYMRPGAPPVRIWDLDSANHNHFEMTMRLTPAMRRVLLVLAPEDVAGVVATFDSARLVETLASPVGGRHVRVMRLYDARGYRGPQIHR